MAFEDIKNVRNFCIIAHIDHGKSTLADRLIEQAGTYDIRKMQAQLLDRMDLERERGITIKLQAVKLEYKHPDTGNDYHINLIDTPGHVDFTYEVSRSLKACEGAVLLVDASQGVEAQTIANLYLAVDAGLEIIPVINKIDLPVARTEEVEEEIIQILGCKREEIIHVSAKTGQGIDVLLRRIIDIIPPPRGDAEAPLKALIFDSHYDSFRGIVIYLRVFDGVIKSRERIRMMQSGNLYESQELGYFNPEMVISPQLTAGDVGYITASIKDARGAKVGDTITHANRQAAEAVPGYREAKPLVFCGLYPSEGEDVTKLRTALEKLQLNDAALHYEQESSEALGLGFRCGFLGLLHMEIVQERLEREFDLELVATSPSVVYNIYKTSGDMISVDNPSHIPERTFIDRIEEPYVVGSIITPAKHMSNILELAKSRRGELGKMEYLPGNRVNISIDLPLAEILYDFYDELKSRTHGYASFDYHISGYRESNLVKVDILINGDPVGPLSFMCHSSQAQRKGRAVVVKLRSSIPRQMFAIPIQAAVGSKVLARENIVAMRKDVTAKCYGGDISRKRKLLEKQKKGKQRMRMMGNVAIPQEAFLAILKVDSEK